ncbi:MAG: M23 family metallopeptidase [Deltaproteobacteria bacterium]|nr:M23 family metallopeptidase [Deltaproteobacteria bacterium]
MACNRSRIIWISENGSGKVYTFSVHTALIKLFVFVVFLCTCSVPVLETGLFELISKNDDLESKRAALHEENVSLHYLKLRLSEIEEKEDSLKSYFGMEGHQSLAQIVGSGGTFGIDLKEIEKDRTDPDAKLYKGLIPSRKSLSEKLDTLSTNYDVFNQLSAKKEEKWQNTPNIIPVDYQNPRISSGFGWRTNPITGKHEFHAGIDILGPKDTKIIAPADGIVIRTGYDRWLGNHILIQHIDNIKTIYGHLKKISVDENALVRRGEVIGIMGNTGMSTSHHLHYGVLIGNRPANPMQYILDVKG